MNDATACKLSRLRAAADCAAHDLAEFAAAERAAEAALDRALADGYLRDVDCVIEDLEDALADAGDEVAAARIRAERARDSLAQAEADTRA